jgi:hypothetical protein
MPSPAWPPSAMSARRWTAWVAGCPAAQLRQRIVDITQVKPDAAMPAFHRSAGLNRVAAAYAGKTLLDAQQVEDLSWPSWAALRVKRRHFLKVRRHGSRTAMHCLAGMVAAVAAVAGPAAADPRRSPATCRPGRGGCASACRNWPRTASSVPLELTVDSPMSEAEHVRSLHVFAERNPRPLVASFSSGPMAGRAQGHDCASASPAASACWPWP